VLHASEIVEMDETEDFIQLVDDVCQRAGMWTLNSTFVEVAAFFTGVATSSNSSPIGRDAARAFNFFVTAKLLVPSKYAWGSAILQVAADDEDAIRRLRDLLVEFATLRKSKTLAEICSDAASFVADYEETEPAKVWRRFLAARYRADRAEIERLIMPHDNASVMWDRNPTPPGVAAELNAISDMYVVSVVGGSLESGRVQLITELGRITAHLINGDWRIDAGPIIENDLQNAQLRA
jgi:hypothetical protein